MYSYIGNLNTTNIYCNPTSLKRLLNNFEMLHNYNNKYSDTRISDICCDIDIALKDLGFNTRIKYELDLWLKGFTEIEISKILHRPQPNIHRDLVKACERISLRLIRGYKNG